MTNTYFKLLINGDSKSKYIAVLLMLALLVGPTVITPSAATNVNTATSPPRLIRTTIIAPQERLINQEMFGTYFLSGQGFTSKLIIHNQRIDLPVTVTPVLLVGKGREIPLDPLTIVANHSITIDLNQALEDRRENKVKSGGLVLRYNFSDTGPIDATVTINHAQDKLSLMSPVMGQAEFMGNVQEGVFWLPDKQTDAFVAVQNTSSEIRRVITTLFVSDRQIRLGKITLAPHETTFVDLKASLPNRTNNTVGAIRLVNDGNPGDIMAEGGLVNHAKGLSKRISFMDTSLHFYDNTLRANFLFLGEPPPELGFPSQVSFRAVCAMRNTSSTATYVHPLVKYLDEGNMRQVRLLDMVLRPGEVTLLDLFDQQSKGVIPASFHMGTLELACDGPAGSLIAELTNLDTGGGYVLGSSFSGHPSRGVGGTFWRIDADWQSIITLTNASQIEDQVKLELIYEGGS